MSSIFTQAAVRKLSSGHCQESSSYIHRALYLGTVCVSYAQHIGVVFSE